MRVLAIACVAAIGCANHVPQDRSTGPDGRVKGAQPIVLENGEAKVSGIVTYPGGDRVDWKVIELPAGKRGRLDLKMQWTTPRPGLQLALDVFDQWNTPVAVAKGSRGRSRETFINDASGKYFVRVYAKGRGDAGAYKLAVAFAETRVVEPPDYKDIPDPPRLPEVPGPPCPTFDAADPGCRNTCPPNGVGAPPYWEACVRAGVFQPKPEAPKPPEPPPPPPPPDPIKARILKADVSGRDTLIIIPAGSDQGVTKTWTGAIMRGDSNTPMAGGTVTIIRIDRTRTVAKVTLTTDTVNLNPYVVLRPGP